MTGQSGNHNHPQNRHPYRHYWLTAGLAIILGAVITALAHSSSGSAAKPSQTPTVSGGPTILPTISSPAPRPSPTTPTTSPPTPTVLPAADKAPVIMSYSNSIDLDDYRSPSWGAQNLDMFSDESKYDLSVGAGNVLDGNQSDGSLVIVTGPRTYDTCASAVNYQKSIYDGIVAGTAICVRTSGHRYAYLSVGSHSVSTGQFEFDKITVWDPPFSQ